MQHKAVFIILQVHCTCFGCQPHPSSGVRKTVTTASGTAHIFCAATSLQRGQRGVVVVALLMCTLQVIVINNIAG